MKNVKPIYLNISKILLVQIIFSRIVEWSFDCVAKIWQSIKNDISCKSEERKRKGRELGKKKWRDVVLARAQK